jgi:lysophospholipid acyltransferase (LPLAT)-like uncharacterized protein
VRGAGYPWWLEPAAFAGALLVRLLGMTWRFEVERAPGYAEGAARGERFVFAFWHARLLPLVYARRHEGITVLVSRHRDGQLITRVVEHLGFTTARGSSTRGGEAGVRELLARATAGHDLAITPDGPRGPAERVKDGLVFVATRTERRIVPIATASRPAWVFRSWDRFRVPRPFARVRIAYGAPIAVPVADEAARAAIESALLALTTDNAARAGEAP